MSALAFKKLPICDLSSVSYNPRKIARKRFKRLQSSVQEHTKSLSGWDVKDGFRLAGTITVNVRGNRIVGGCQRVEVLKSLGQDWICDLDITWVDLEPDSPEEKALCISLNDQEASGRWDDGKLKPVLDSIRNELDELYHKLDLSVLDRKIAAGKKGIDGDVDDEMAEIKARRVQFIDNIGFVVQEILDKHGDTIDNGFLVFTYKDRVHLIVNCDDEAYAMTKMVVDLLKRDNKEINGFLTNAFRLGIQSAGWEKDAPRSEDYKPGADEESEEDAVEAGKETGC
jgi:hypothetical protein